MLDFSYYSYSDITESVFWLYRSQSGQVGEDGVFKAADYREAWAI